MTTVDQLTRYERAVSWPLVTVAIVFLVAYAWPILDPDLPAQLLQVCLWIEYATWAIFVVDYLTRLYLAANKWHFFKNNLVDLTLIILPMIRSLRALRILMLLRVLNNRASISFHGRVAWYVAIATLAVIFTGALAALDAERYHPEANITSFADAIWWAIVTMTTVGYGDYAPASPTGRGIAIGLMLSGIALLGVITATVASWLISRVEEIEESSEAATRDDIRALQTHIESLQEQLRALGTNSTHTADIPKGSPTEQQPSSGTTRPSSS